MLQSHIKFNDLENQLNQHETLPSAAGDSVVNDFGAVLQILNDVTKSIGLNRSHVLMVLLWMETVVAWTDECCIVQSKRRHPELNNRISFARNTCHLLLAKAHTEGKRGKILLQMVRNVKLPARFVPYH